VVNTGLDNSPYTAALEAIRPSVIVSRALQLFKHINIL